MHRRFLSVIRVDVGIYCVSIGNDTGLKTNLHMNEIIVSCLPNHSTNNNKKKRTEKNQWPWRAIRSGDETKKPNEKPAHTIIVREGQKNATQKRTKQKYKLLWHRNWKSILMSKNLFALSPRLSLCANLEFQINVLYHSTAWLEYNGDDIDIFTVSSSIYVQCERCSEHIFAFFWFITSQDKWCSICFFSLLSLLASLLLLLLSAHAITYLPHNEMTLLSTERAPLNWLWIWLYRFCGHWPRSHTHRWTTNRNGLIII